MSGEVGMEQSSSTPLLQHCVPSSRRVDKRRVVESTRFPLEVGAPENQAEVPRLWPEPLGPVEKEIGPL
jgi:hypothetical protein